jgi:hypothetical protein
MQSGERHRKRNFADTLDAQGIPNWDLRGVLIVAHVVHSAAR